MPQALIVPGVSVATRYEVSPPSMAARSGVLGAVGVVDRDPGDGPTGVTTSQELVALFGPATRYSFPEAFSALANGVSEVILSPVDDKSGKAAEVILKDDEDQNVAILRARAAGPWGNDISVRVVPTLGADGETVRRINLTVLYKGKIVERHNNLIMRPGNDSDFFEVINRDSSIIVAVDPIFEVDLPATDAEPVALPDAASRAATGALTRSSAAVLNLAASKKGKAGNDISFEVKEGHALLNLEDASSNAVVRVLAQKAGDDQAAIEINVTSNVTEGLDVQVIGLLGTRTYTGLQSVQKLVDALNADPEVAAQKLGDVPPDVTGSAVSLNATRTVVMRVKGVSTETFNDMADAQAIVDALTTDGTVTATLVGSADAQVDAAAANAFSLTGGRDAGRAVAYKGENNPSDDIIEIAVADSVDDEVAANLRIQVAKGSQTGTVRVLVGSDNEGTFTLKETFDNLSMDPDNPRYLVRVLDQSEFIRGADLYKPQGAVDFPSATRDPAQLTQGALPPLSAFKNAVDLLASEDAVDLMLAGLQEWKDANLDGFAVQQHMLGHCRSQADKARPRIALGSIRPDDARDVKAIMDHAGRVSGRRFVLTTPSGVEGAVAGLLGHLEFFQSPTFKTIASPGVPLIRYSDSELNKLVGSEGNVCVVMQKRGRGTICIKGISTTGDQISVTRIADNCVRRVKAIADKFIGELNNVDSRNALKQMIIATFIQMERDGALVPSVDGSSPAFQVEVYASQTDAAAGILRIDIAVRPVRAIDYIYATITVQN